VCFRLLAALGEEGPPFSASDALALGVRCGLDIRAAPPPAQRTLEVAWGACGCSLYTRKEGRDRTVSFVEGLLQRGWKVQLLLGRDDEPMRWEAPVSAIAWEVFAHESVACLPEGQVALIQPPAGTLVPGVTREI